jgi:predicted XRE-type DNA-binding protein
MLQPADSIMLYNYEIPYPHRYQSGLTSLLLQLWSKRDWRRRKNVKSAADKSRHVTRGNVFDDLGFSPEQAIALKFKAQLYQAILKCSQKYSQKELQAILGEPQPRVSELLNGKIANKSIDTLLYYAGRLGIETRAKFV